MLLEESMYNRSMKCRLDYCPKEAHTAKLCRSHYEQQRTGEPLRPVRYHLDEQTKRQAVDELKIGLTLETVAKRYDVNIVTASRWFVQYEGMSLREYRRQENLTRC